MDAMREKLGWTYPIWLAALALRAEEARRLADKNLKLKPKPVRIREWRLVGGRLVSRQRVVSGG